MYEDDLFSWYFRYYSSTTPWRLGFPPLHDGRNVRQRLGVGKRKFHGERGDCRVRLQRVHVRAVRDGVRHSRRVWAGRQRPVVVRVGVGPAWPRPCRLLPAADQTWNWVIGSPGQWVIWVIFHVRVTGSSFWPGLRPELFRFSKKCPKCKTHIWNAEMTKVMFMCLLLDLNHWMSVHAMNFYCYLWLGLLKNYLAWEYFFTHMSTFGVHYRTGSPGQLGLRVAGFPGHWVAGSQNATQFRLCCGPWQSPTTCSCCRPGWLRSARRSSSTLTRPATRPLPTSPPTTTRTQTDRFIPDIPVFENTHFSFFFRFQKNMTFNVFLKWHIKKS